MDNKIDIITIEPQFKDYDVSELITGKESSKFKEKLRGTYKNKQTGWNIKLSGKGVSHAINSATSRGMMGIDHMEALANLPAIIENMTLIETHDDRYSGTLKNIHRFYLPVNVNEKIYAVKLTVKEHNKKFVAEVDDIYKLYDLSLVKKMPEDLIANPPHSNSILASTELPTSGIHAITIREMLEGVKDHNGKPFINPDDTVNYKQKGDTSNTLYQLAYHGTPHNFDEFSLDGIGTSEGAQAHGWGLYFAKNKTTAKRYKKGLEKNKDGQLFEVDIPENDVLLDEQKTFSEQNKNVKKLLVNTIKSLSPEQQNRFLQEVLGKKLGESDKTIKVYGELHNLKLLQQSLNIAETKSAGLRRLKKDNLLEHGYTEEQIEEFANNKELAEKEKAKYDSEIKQLEEQYKEAQQEDEKRNQEKIESAVSNPEEALQGYLNIGEKLYKAIAYAVTDKQYNYMETSKFLNEHGIKGITYDGGRDGRCFVVFDDKAISVLEKYYQEQRNNTSPRGLIRFNPKTQEAMITVFKDKKDFSTVLHETSHYFLQTLANAYQMENAPAWVKENFETLAKEMGFDPNKPLSTETHERFARLGEAYFREGKAPREELAGAFNMFKGWLTSLYRYVSKLLGKDSLNDEIRSVFDNMLATEEQIERAKRNREKESSIQTLAKKFNLKQEQIDLLQKEKDRADKKASAIILLEKVKGLKDTEDTARQEVKELIANNEFYKAIGHFRMILGIKIIFLCYEQSS